MTAPVPEGFGSFLEGLEATDRSRALAVLRACATIDVAPGPAHLLLPLPEHALLLVAKGFVVLRATAEPALRSVITCEAGAGQILLPPGPEETLAALGNSSLTVVDGISRTELLRVPALAERIVERLAFALEQKQEATANFAQTLHIERVRRSLLHLARIYGHVARDGIRIDFPVSHALLAEMIGSSRETVTRAVDQLQRTGFVDRRGTTYRLRISADCVFDYRSAVSSAPPRDRSHTA